MPETLIFRLTYVILPRRTDLALPLCGNLFLVFSAKFQDSQGSHEARSSLLGREGPSVQASRENACHSFRRMRTQPEEPRVTDASSGSVCKRPEVGAEANGIANGAKDLGRSWDVEFVARKARFTG